VTDEEGRDRACSGFDVEDARKLSEEEYLDKEREWVNNWAEKIINSKFDDSVDWKEYK
jgi:hypothetical protein